MCASASAEESELVKTRSKLSLSEPCVVLFGDHREVLSPSSKSIRNSSISLMTRIVMLFGGQNLLEFGSKRSEVRKFSAELAEAVCKIASFVWCRIIGAVG